MWFKLNSVLGMVSVVTAPKRPVPRLPCTAKIPGGCFKVLKWVEWDYRVHANGIRVQYSLEFFRAAACGAPAAVVAPRAIFRRTQLSRAEADYANARAAHRVRERAMPEHGRVLGARHRDVHDPGKHLHARVRILRRAKRKATGTAGGR